MSTRTVPAPTPPGCTETRDGREKCLAWGLLLFLSVAAWRWAGLRAADGPFFAAAAALLLAAALVARPRSWWSRDPFFWFGLVFLAYLACQRWNAGRELRFDDAIRRWAYTDPPHPRWPWAFSRPEAAQMLHWFFPAWAAGLCVRCPALSRRGLRPVLHGLAYNAAALALFGTVRELAGAQSLFGYRPAYADFFATFTYTNHAAAYFLLMAALAAGLLFRQVFRRDRPGRRIEKAALAASLLLCLVGANLSLSRAGIILSWALALFIAGYGLARGWRLWRPAARLRMAVLTAAAAVVFVLTVAGAGGEAIRREFTLRRRPAHQAVPGLEQVNLDLSDRPRLWGAAWAIFRDHPWYGTGGWGFRYLAAFYLPRDHWSSLKSNPGRANAHCDPLQFLVEFGIAGAGGLALAWGALAAGLFRRDLARGALFTLSCAGLTLVAAFSLIDLPFRCPSVLWTWTVVLAALPKCTAREPREVGAAAVKH
ncbi:MAG TPA: O-antigen ligase family protein [Kiritimatiellia bacterium]|nr:O-antigen ligase family protein [Kiritimatiellia bacterium]HRZ12348.1 O-antigen ligase family protein [Kiritimatiellia bacterium]HSA17894.1 O-antigen ligase family protein [Kiritimatiellia bacterium]